MVLFMLRARLLLATYSKRPIRTRPSIQMARNISFRSTFRDAPIPVPSELSVKLTPLEDQLCTLLDECKHDLANKGQDVECRIAGGWVRDKVRRGFDAIMDD